MQSKLQLKRIYDPREEQDGTRFLVERLWPRGVTKAALADVQWLKEVAPSTELRKWFNHDPARWNEFRRRYFVELKHHRDNLSPIFDAARRGPVTLLYSSHDSEHNNAVASANTFSTWPAPRILPAFPCSSSPGPHHESCFRYSCSAA